MYAIFKIKQNFKKSSNKPNILANIEEKKSNLYLLAKNHFLGDFRFLKNPFRVVFKGSAFFFFPTDMCRIPKLSGAVGLFQRKLLKSPFFS